MAHLIIKIYDEIKSYPSGFSKNLIEFVVDRAGHDFRYAINHSKITDELGWKPKTEFNYGIRKTVEWYLQKYI